MGASGRWARCAALGLTLLAAAAPAGRADAETGADWSREAAARLGAGDHAFEHWDLSTRFSSGHRIFVRFSISNEGPGSPAAYALGQIVFPDGEVVPFKNGKLEGGWELSAEGQRIEVSSSLLDLSVRPCRFEVDKNGKGIRIFLRFEPGDEPPRRWRSAPAGVSHALLALAGEAHGTLWVRERMGEGAAPVPLEGRASLTHVWMEERESDRVVRRVESHLLSGGATAAYWVALQTVEGEARSWAVLRGVEGSIETGAFSVEEVGARPGRDLRYPLPAALTLRGALEGGVELGPVLIDHDPLAVVPRPFRWLLAFRLRPRQIWVDSRLELRVSPGAGPSVAEGPAETSWFYLNPSPRGDAP